MIGVSRKHAKKVIWFENSFFFFSFKLFLLKPRFSFGQDVIKYLIRELGADPTSDNNEAFSLAAYSGKMEVVKYLVDECGVDPTSGNCQAIRRALWNGNDEMTNYLMNFIGPDKLDSFYA